MHLPPPSTAPTESGRPCGGRHPPHRKNRERRRRRGVKRRREREKKERCASVTHTDVRVRVRAEKDGQGESGTAAPITITWRAATALPTAAARATTRPLHHAARSAPVTLRWHPESALQSIFATAAGYRCECTLLCSRSPRECTANYSPLSRNSAAATTCDCEVCADSDTDNTRDVLIYKFTVKFHCEK